MQDYIEKNGGATIKNNSIIEYKRGYQIAVNSSEKMFNTFKDLQDYIKEQSLTCVGVWIYNNQYCMDTNTMHINNKAQAIALAKEHKQKAIWDWYNKKEIFV